MDLRTLPILSIILRRSFLGSGGLGGFFGGSSLSSGLGGSLGGGFLSLGLLGGDSLGASLVYLSLCSLGSLCLGNFVILDAGLLVCDLLVAGFFPGGELGVGLSLGESTLGNTFCEVLAQENTLIGEDAAGRERGLGTYLEPSQGLVAIQNDGGRVGVGVVGAKLLDEFTVARCAGVGHNNVEECEILLSVALKSDFNSHCESVFN